MRGGKRSTSFRPGQSGNPSGKAKDPARIAEKKLATDVKEAAKALTQDAVDTLAAIMRDGGKPAAARVSAATALLDRGWGKPAQEVALGGKAGAPPIPVATISAPEFEEIARRVASDI